MRAAARRVPHQILREQHFGENGRRCGRRRNCAAVAKAVAVRSEGLEVIRKAVGEARYRQAGTGTVIYHILARIGSGTQVGATAKLSIGCENACGRNRNGSTLTSNDNNAWRSAGGGVNPG